MIDFLFVSKTTASKKATLRVDMVDSNIERFTVMWCDGVRGTEFENVLPWHQGSVLSRSDIETWAQQNSENYSVYEYGGDQIVLVGAQTHDIKITPTITGGNNVTIKMTGSYEGMPDITDVIDLENSVVKTVKGIEGYNYTFSIVTEKANWTSSAPEAVKVDGDEEVAIQVTISA